MAKRKQNDGDTAVAEPAKIDPAQDRINGRKIAELAGIKLDKQARRIIFADKVAIRVVPWNPYQCWDDAMMAADCAQLWDHGISVVPAGNEFCSIDQHGQQICGSNGPNAGPRAVCHAILHILKGK